MNGLLGRIGERDLRGLKGGSDGRDLSRGDVGRDIVKRTLMMDVGVVCGCGCGLLLLRKSLGKLGGAWRRRYTGIFVDTVVFWDLNQMDIECAVITIQ